MQIKRAMISVATFILIFFLASAFDIRTTKSNMIQTEYVSTERTDASTIEASSKFDLIELEANPYNNILLASAFDLSQETDVSRDILAMSMLSLNETVSYDVVELDAPFDSTDPISVEEQLADLDELGETYNIIYDEDATTDDTKDEASKDEPVEEAKYANIGISNAKDYVNIRKSANTDSEILGKLYRDSAATILSTEGEWYYVESGSVVGYVKAEYLTTGLSDEELIDKYGTVMVRVDTDGLNVRKEPDQESNRRTCIYLGEIYPVLSIQDGWIEINVEDDGVTGYVAEEYVDVIVEFTTAISKAEEEEKARIEAEKKAEAERKEAEKKAEAARKEAEERAKKETAVIQGSGFSYTQDDLKLLVALVHAEAGNQSYEGKLAVANVVLNRVKSSKYPNSIHKVIYQSGQFTVASSGSLAKQLANYDNYSSSSQKLTIKAVKAALGGSNNIGSRLYFNAYRTAVKKGYVEKYSNSVKIQDHLFW